MHAILAHPGSTDGLPLANKRRVAQRHSEEVIASDRSYQQGAQIMQWMGHALFVDVIQFRCGIFGQTQCYGNVKSWNALSVPKSE